MDGMSVLVAVAHPDDEVLGAGGTIARLARSGSAVHLLYLTDGTGARSKDRAAARRRETAARRAAEILGAKPPRFLRFPDNRIDSVPLLEVIKAIESVVLEVAPSHVYTHHAGDLNVDHSICVRAVLTACRPLPGSMVRHIYAIEIPSSTEWALPGADSGFVPSRFVDITASLPTKLAALEAYAEEIRPFPHPRSTTALEALARFRGASAGLEAAEAFVVLREIVGPAI
jgi:LmbE family N-acetylglucosaminyl deacetylase